MKNILIVAAHPDDEILGCGATVAKLKKESGCHIFSLILGEGATSRNDTRDALVKPKEVSQLSKQCLKANKLIGVEKVFKHDLPDQRFDSVDILDIVKIIEKCIKEVGPDTIFTHYENDINIDHKLTFLAVMAATRPMPTNLVKNVYSFEVLSSTEWSYPLSFSPNTFFDVTNYFDIKLQALKAYSSELRSFPHPRSLKGVRLNASNWGLKTGLGLVEAFACIRSFK
jgi:LmbE family N-acetylglucosaminyl deacetylase